MKNLFKVISINVLVLALLLLAGEAIVRLFINYNPAYYTALETEDGCRKYAYGTICFNSNRYPDEEFDTDSEKPRIGYIGDSVCAGLGAGQPYRITDLLKQHYSQYEHWNFCKYGSAVMTREALARNLKNVDRFGLNTVVYLLNLNDISPTAADTGAQPDVPNVKEVKRSFKKLGLDWLRGRSYLYTYARNIVKSYLTVQGYQHSGYQAVEFFPGANAEQIRAFSQRVREFANEMKDRGVEFIIVLLPYEMQVSVDAARAYAEIGIEWEDGFLAGSAQRVVAENLASSDNVRIIDTREAFRGLVSRIGVGEYYVFNEGDKIDWNHPNRTGHRIIGEYLIENEVFRR
jgi:hypothetical protein